MSRAILLNIRIERNTHIFHLNALLFYNIIFKTADMVFSWGFNMLIVNSYLLIKQSRILSAHLIFKR